MKHSLSFLYVGLAVFANWLAATYIVHVPFTPYMAPAGVFCIGVILVLRDWIQQIAAKDQAAKDRAAGHIRFGRRGLKEPSGLRYTLALVPIGGGLSYVIGVLAGYGSFQKIAVASLIAFCVSETVEAAVFTPIRKRNLAFGVALSGTVGNAIDSALFLYLAFGSEAFFAGNFYGKLEMIAVGTALTAARRVVFPVAQTA